MAMFRQGDVLIVPIASMPKLLEPIERESDHIILAQGELTGHAHAIKDKRATLFRDPKLSAVFMEVTGDAPVVLEHDQHDAISIPPGTYQIVRQVEYSPAAIRTVLD